MIAYPDIQSKVQTEIDRTVGPQDLPNVSHRPNICITDAVLREGMGLSSVAPTTVPHKTLCDTSVGDYNGPKSTMVSINFRAINHDRLQ